MTTVGEVHAQNRVAWLQHGHVDGHVGLGAGVRLDVGVLGAEQLLRARDRERLGDVHEFATTVIPLPGIALGVLVRHHRPGRLEHGQADEVLGRDELEAVFLAVDFVRDGRRDVGIDRRQVAHRDESSAAILSSRCWCRPPENGVSRNTFTSARASSGGVSRAPSASTLRSLCIRLSFAASSVPMAMARMPATLLAAIAMPIPDPHTRMPRSKWPAATSWATLAAKSG